MKMARKLHDDDDDDDGGGVNPGRMTGIVVPRPDPTTLTTAAVDKATKQLRSELDRRFEAVDTRLNAMDKATNLIHEDFVRVPTSIDRAIANLHELLEQKIHTFDAALRGDIADISQRFGNIDMRFTERDLRFAQHATDTKAAFDASLTATRETTNKIETSFQKQIDAMKSILETNTSNLTGKIDDVKQRLTAIESRGVGATEVRRDSRDNMGLIIAVIAAAIALGTLFLKSNGLH